LRSNAKHSGRISSSSTRSNSLIDDVRIGLTFDDVLLVPRFSNIVSRRDVDTRTHLTRKVELAIPIISANMDTVTEEEMAVTMAREGGIGIIHRYMSKEEQVEQVRRVKRSESIIIESPYSLRESAKVVDVIAMMSEKRVGGILIVDDEGKLQGIVTSRDLRFVEDLEKPVTEVMTKRNDMVVAPWRQTSIDKAKEIMEKAKVEKLPLVDSHDRLMGLVTAKDILKRKQFPAATKDSKGRLRVGAAIGVKGDFLDRAKELIKAEADVLVLDIAHGHSQHAIEAIKRIKKESRETELIAGNVATAEGASDLAKAGADSVKVGVGSGSICITRIITGSGVPQLTAIADCSKALREFDGVTLIADGGIRNSGDITKALVAGADSVMIGSLLAGTDESPGEIVFRGDHRYKVTRGMASLQARRDKMMREKMLQSNQGAYLSKQDASEQQARRGGESVGREEEEDLTDYVPEGVEGIVPYRGGAVSVIRQLVGGLRSGMSYCGAKNIAELRSRGKFIRITEVGLAESKPHDVITEL
jgi:IMP dehydrogenase